MLSTPSMDSGSLVATISEWALLLIGRMPYLAITSRGTSAAAAASGGC